MPQDMVARSLSDSDLSTAVNGSVGQAHSPYYPNGLLLKMPYRFNRGYQFLPHSSAGALFDSFLA